MLEIEVDIDTDMVEATTTKLDNVKGAHTAKTVHGKPWARLRKALG